MNSEIELRAVNLGGSTKHPHDGKIMLSCASSW